MDNHITKLRELVNHRKYTLGSLQEFKSRSEHNLDLAKLEVEYLTKARWVLSEVSRITQRNFAEYMESLVTMAINGVFVDRNFKFITNFEIKRNKAECTLMVQEDEGDPYFPKDEMGGGLLDIISIALRVVFWSLEKPRSRALFLLDEPMKFVGKGEMFHRAVSLLRDISKRLGIQFLINTHEEGIAEVADRAWLVKHDGTMSSVSPLFTEGGSVRSDKRRYKPMQTTN